MAEKQFEYGQLARGSYKALIAVSIIMPFLGLKALLLHLLLLLFLGFALRPLLEKTGLYRLLQHVLLVAVDKSFEKFERERREEIDLKARDEFYRRRRLKHPDLPKDW